MAQFLVIQKMVILRSTAHALGSTSFNSPTRYRVHHAEHRFRLDRLEIIFILSHGRARILVLCKPPQVGVGVGGLLSRGIFRGALLAGEGGVRRCIDAYIRHRLCLFHAQWSGVDTSLKVSVGLRAMLIVFFLYRGLAEDPTEPERTEEGGSPGLIAYCCPDPWVHK